MLKKDEFIRRCTLDRVVDGDTVDVVLDLGFSISYKERLRLRDIDCPEMRGIERERGKEAKQAVIDWCEKAEEIWCHSYKYTRGKYGRVIADLFDENGGSLVATLKVLGHDKHG